MLKNFYCVKYFYINILLVLFIFFSGCDKEKKEAIIPKKQDNGFDTFSFVIKYSVAGNANGKITMTKKADKVKFELEKIISGESNIESRFISDGWIYFYFVTETTVQPVKSKIFKDQNYLKNIASLTDAEEIISRTKKNGNEIVAGFVCDIYDNSDGSRFYIYGGKYVLKTVYDGIIITANSLSLNAPIQNQDVEKPANVEFLELTLGPQ
jgi:hypothetical protein